MPLSSPTMRAKTSVRYLDKTLVASDSFHTLGVGTTTLRVEYEGEAIEIEFVVSAVEGQPVNQMWAQVVSSDRLQVHLVNFHQIMPSQTLGPKELGLLAGRQVILILEATGVKGTPSKHISYSLYLGEANG
jgi:hypothetical protein